MQGKAGLLEVVGTRHAPPPPALSGLLPGRGQRGQRYASHSQQLGRRETATTKYRRGKFRRWKFRTSMVHFIVRKLGEKMVSLLTSQYSHATFPLQSIFISNSPTHDRRG